MKHLFHHLSPLTTRCRVLFLSALFFVCVFDLSAVSFRIAAYNIENGFGDPDTAEYQAARAVIARVDPDVLAITEAMGSDFANFAAMAAELGYTYGVQSEMGPFDTSLRTAFLSRYPITSIDTVTPPPGAKELTRANLAVTIDLPGTDENPTFIVVHYKCCGFSADLFRRAIEAYRTAEYVRSILAETQGNVFVLGDLNLVGDNIVTFNSIPSGLPGTYNLGMDVQFPVVYQRDPNFYFQGTGLAKVEMAQDNGNPATWNTRTSANSVLDFILAPEAVRARGYQTEVYNSALDATLAGLPKTGPPLPANTSSIASDHYLIYGDFLFSDPPSSTTPSATYSPQFLDAFATDFGTASPSQTYTFSATDLDTNEPVSFQVEPGFEISIAGSPFAASALWTPPSSTASVSVTVRIAADAISGRRHATVSHYAGGQFLGHVYLSGQVTPPPGNEVPPDPTGNLGRWSFNFSSFENGQMAADSAQFGNPVLSVSGWTGGINNFSGSFFNALPTESSGDSLSLVGQAGNGSFIELSFSMLGFEELTIAFATRGTNTGFDSGQWSFSRDGEAFVNFGHNTATRNTFYSIATLTTHGLDGAADARLRYTLNGATSTSGNNRIDNLTLTAQPAEVALNPFEQWIGGYGLSGPAADPSFDPSGGGVPNLLKFAFGGLPAVNDHSILPVLRTVSQSDGIYLEYLMYLDREFAWDSTTATLSGDGIVLQIEQSDTLGSWGPAAVAPLGNFPSNIIPEGTSVTFRALEPISDQNPARFIRTVAWLDAL